MLIVVRDTKLQDVEFKGGYSSDDKVQYVNILIIYRSCAKNILTMCQQHANHIPPMCQEHANHVPTTC